MSSKPKSRNILVVLLVMLACNVPSPFINTLVPGGTWYVEKTGDDSNDCLSATSACLTINAAVSKALTAGVIQIGPGIFEEISSSDPDDRALYYTGLYISNKVLTFRGTVTDGTLETIISGGNARTAVEVRGSAILIFQDLIIQDGGGVSGDGAGYGLKITGSARSGSTAGVQLTNVIIRNNDFTGLYIKDRGPVTLDDVQVLANGYGLFSNPTGPITIKNSSFSGNTNGAIRNGGTMVIIDSTISDNGTRNNSGAIENHGDMKIEGSTISGTLNSSDSDGTGVYNRGTLLTMLSSTVTGNSGMGIGSFGELNLNDVEVSHNNGEGVKFFEPVVGTFLGVTLSDNGGYGLHSEQGHVTIENSHIVSNHNGGIFNNGWAAISDTEITGNFEGGVVNSVSGTMTIDRSTISGTLPRTDGTSPYYLPGIYNAGTSLTVSNSTISENTGVGILTTTSMSLVFSTVAENGDGIRAGSGSVFHLENSIVENNMGQNCVSNYIPPVPVFEHVGVNLSDVSCYYRGDGDGTLIIISSDDFLGPLADNGGSTQTNALLPGSPAIDAVTGACLFTSDQRGVERPQGPSCDIGAYEAGGSAIAPLEFVTPSGGVPGVIPLYTDTPEPFTPVILTFAKNAYCRKGPGSLYKDVSGFKQGDTTQADGRNEVDPRWWWVQIPASTEHCWVSYITVDPNGLAEDLPIQPIVSLDLPTTPSDLVISKRACSPNGFSLTLAWTKSADADGYTLYRNGEKIATFKSSQTVYQENPPMNKSLTYELEAFNSSGFSERLVVEDGGCK